MTSQQRNLRAPLLRELRRLEDSFGSLYEAEVFGAAADEIEGRTEKSGEPTTCTERDAARYEWLREHWNQICTEVDFPREGPRHVLRIFRSSSSLAIDPQSLDQAIDAVIAAEEERAGG